MEWNQEHFHNFGGARGVCKGFSFSSRRRMLDRLNQVSVDATLPDFVTLTLPDESFHDSVPVFACKAKALLDIQLKRLHRACPSASAFWRIEWKARKSGLHEGKLFPHFHLLVWGLPDRSVETSWGANVQRFESYVPVKDYQTQFAGLCGEVVSNHCFASKRQAMRFVSRYHHGAFAYADKPLDDPRSYVSFFDWLSTSWYHVVASHNYKHFMAGVRVERIRSWGGVLSYCAKYMSKADSENWMVDVPAGRSWGISNRACVPWAKMFELPLDEEVGVRVRRICRRYMEHKLGRRVQRHFGLTLFCDVAQFKRLLEHPPDTPF